MPTEPIRAPAECNLGPFQLDLTTRRLRRRGAPVEIEPTVFSLLVFLVENRNRACPRDEVLAACWDGASVSPSALESAVKRLRQVLGDDGIRQDYIETVRGFGYRYVGPYETDQPISGAPDAPIGPRMKVLICDDHAIFRAGLQATLTSLEVDVFEVSSTEEALAMLAAEPEIDIVLLDLEMPGPDGFAALGRIREDHPGTPVVVCSAHDERAVVQRVLGDGASGFIAKSSSPDVLRSALQLVMQGGVYEPPLPVGANESMEPIRTPIRSDAAPPSVTDRQREILRMLTRGLSNAEIAAALSIAEGTVKSHVSALFGVLGVSNRTEAALAARKLGVE